MQRTNGIATSSRVADPQSHARSRVSNGRALFIKGIDGRSLWARRFRDLIELHVTDLGGPDECSEAKCSLIRRIAALEVELERMEGQFAQTAASADDFDLYQRGANTLRRLLVAIGLERRAKRWAA